MDREEPSAEELGKSPATAERVSIAGYDPDQYVQEEPVATARALLTTRYPHVADVLAQIRTRQGFGPASPPVPTRAPEREVIHGGDSVHVGELIPRTQL